MGEELNSDSRYMGNETLDKRFRHYQYGDFMIYKNTPQWFIWDNSLKQVILIKNTLKEIKESVDLWRNCLAKSGAQ